MIEILQPTPNRIQDRTREKARVIKSTLDSMDYAHAIVEPDEFYSMPYQDLESMLIVTLGDVYNPNYSFTREDDYQINRAEAGSGYDYRIKFNGLSISHLERTSILHLPEQVMESILLDIVGNRIKNNLNLNEIANSVEAGAVSIYFPKHKVRKPENLLTPKFRESH